MKLKYNTKPPSPLYGSTWFNIDDGRLRAYNNEGQWVTREETSDPVLLQLLEMEDVINGLRDNREKVL